MGSGMDDQNKNLLLATILSFAVMLLWFAIAPPPSPEPDAVEQTTTQPVAEVAPAQQPAQTTTDTTVATVADAPRIQIETPRLSGSMS